MRKELTTVAILFCLGFSSPGAAGPAWEFEEPGNSFTNGSWDFANSFSVLEAVDVSGLGWFADPVTGNVDANPVSLWMCDTAGCLTSGTLLTQVIVDNTFPVVGNFRFVTVPGITLLPGDYLVGGVSDTNNYTWNNPGFSVDPRITYNDNRWFDTTSGATPTFNTTLRNDVTDGYWGPNLFFGQPTFTDPIPEPTTWAMLLLGFLGIGGAIRSSRARNRTALSLA